MIRWRKPKDVSTRREVRRTQKREAGFWKGDKQSTKFTEFKDLNGTTLKLED